MSRWRTQGQRRHRSLVRRLRSRNPCDRSAAQQRSKAKSHIRGRNPSLSTSLSEAADGRAGTRFEQGQGLRRERVRAGTGFEQGQKFAGQFAERKDGGFGGLTGLPGAFPGSKLKLRAICAQTRVEGERNYPCASEHKMRGLLTGVDNNRYPTRPPCRDRTDETFVPPPHGRSKAAECAPTQLCFGLQRYYILFDAARGLELSTDQLLRRKSQKLVRAHDLYATRKWPA